MLNQRANNITKAIADTRKRSLKMPAQPLQPSPGGVKPPSLAQPNMGTSPGFQSTATKPGFASPAPVSKPISPGFKQLPGQPSPGGVQPPSMAQPDRATSPGFIGGKIPPGQYQKQIMPGGKALPPGFAGKPGTVPPGFENKEKSRLMQEALKQKGVYQSPDLQRGDGMNPTNTLQYHTQVEPATSPGFASPQPVAGQQKSTTGPGNMNMDLSKYGVDVNDPALQNITASMFNATAAKDTSGGSPMNPTLPGNVNVNDPSQNITSNPNPTPTTSTKPAPPQYASSNAEITQSVLKKIREKALAGQAMSDPTAEKQALYDLYKNGGNPTLGSTTDGISENTLAQIKQKAMAGIPLSDPTAEKLAIYNMYAPPGTGAVNENPEHFEYKDPRWESNQTIPDFMGMTPDMIQKALEGYTSGSQYYDPSQDPVYKAMLELSGKQADKAGLNAMELMNERGILNSTVTADRLGQIGQSASDSVLGAIPGLAANFDNKQLNNMNGLQNLISQVIGAGEFQQGFAEDNYRFDKNFQLDEAEVTGSYMTPEAKAAYQQVIDAKRIAGNPNSTAEQRKRASDQANAARDYLATNGFNISDIGANATMDRTLNAKVGNQTMDNKRFMMESGLAEGELTGSYVPAEAKGLVDQLIKLKQANGNKSTPAKEKNLNASRANQIRSQLASLGVDADNLFGAHIGIKKAMENATKMGKQTQSSKEFDRTMQEERYQFDKELGHDRYAFDKEYGLQRDQLGQERYMFDKEIGQDRYKFDREMNYTEQQALIDADLKSRGLDLEEVSLSIQRFSTESDAEYKSRLADLEIDAQTASRNTSAAIGEALKSSSMSDAVAFIAESAGSWASRGVDVSKVLDSLEYKFPGLGEAVTSTGGPAYTQP